MKHLLDLLDGGTRGTLAEPSQAACEVCEKRLMGQTFTSIGTLGTRGTHEIHQTVPVDDFAQRVACLAEAYAERIAIIAADAPDVTATEARRIAEAELGAAFVRSFMPGEVLP